MHNPVPHNHSIHLSGQPGECGEIYEFIDAALAGVAGGKPVSQELKLVLEEIHANILKHGNQDSSGCRIDFNLSVFANHIEIQVRDNGSEFNPLTYDSVQAGRDLSEGGMGVHIIKSLTDSQSYERKDGYNYLTLTRHYGKA